jgi:predicted nuclease of predicted toxin-antitoxin system
VRFLADESCDFAVVRALRAAGHDVTAVASVERGLTDDAVAHLALTEGRMLLTEDRDFGQLVYARSRQTAGVVYIRYPSQARQRLGDDVVALVERQSSGLAGAFVVMQPGRARISRPGTQLGRT